MAIDPQKIQKGRTAADATNDYVGAVMETVERGFDRVNENLDRLTAAQEKTELALAQLTSQVNATGKHLNKVGDEISELRKAIAEHLALAQSQARNIDSQNVTVQELTKLVATQARTVEVLISRAS